MLREFARVEAFEKVTPIDLLPLRALDSHAQSTVLGILWERLQKNQQRALKSDWFVRELLVEVSKGTSKAAQRFNPKNFITSIVAMAKSRY